VPAQDPPGARVPRLERCGCPDFAIKGVDALSVTGLVAPGRRQKNRRMSCIQLALSDAAKADVLRALLARSTQLPVRCVAQPCLEEACVVVVDPPHLRLLPRPLAFPDRVVLLTPNDPSHLRDAWEAGVSSVVTDQDPPNTVVLAILSACLRSGTADTKQVLGRKFN
jgi:hypothetical protein